MKKFIKSTIILFLITFTLFAPSLSFAQNNSNGNSGLVPCGTDKSPIESTTDASGKVTQTGGDILNPCGFDHVLQLINNVINFLLFVLVIPIAAIMFCYAGFTMLFSGGEASARTKAKGIFWNVVIGLIIAVGAWVIIHTLLDIVGAKTGDGWNWFGLF